MSVRISGAGCALMDFLYTNVPFHGPLFEQYQSRTPGDGGLSPGKLVFLDELERFAGEDFERIRATLTGNREPDAANLGGPSIVALIQAAQLLQRSNTDVSFFGAHGSDPTALSIMEILRRTPVNTRGYRVFPGQTPFTVVFSDPEFDSGHGERTFVNNVGAAGHYGPHDIDPEFFEGDLAVFGGTGLVPSLHAHIGVPLKRAKERNMFTIVNTVYDFLNQKMNPLGRWPLGENDETFRHIDLFIADREEAFRTTGTETIPDAIDFLKDQGVGAAVITQGAQPVHFYSTGRSFIPTNSAEIPVSETVVNDLSENSVTGDTTGCGDNFVGGVIASLVGQMRGGAGSRLDLRLACSLGVVSGGYARYYMGGTFIESHPGEKRERLLPLYRDYLRQIGLRPKSTDGIFE